MLFPIYVTDFKKFKMYKLIKFFHYDFNENPENVCLKPKPAEKDSKTTGLLMTLLEGALSHGFQKAGMEI